MGTTLGILLPETVAPISTTPTTSTTSTSTVALSSNTLTAGNLQAQHQREIEAEMMTLLTPYLNKSTRKTMANLSPRWRATQRPIWEYYIRFHLQIAFDKMSTNMLTGINTWAQNYIATRSVFYRAGNTTPLNMPTQIAQGKAIPAEERDLLFAAPHIFPQTVLQFEGNYSDTYPPITYLNPDRFATVELFAYSVQSPQYYALGTYEVLGAWGGTNGIGIDPAHFVVNLEHFAITDTSVSCHFVVIYTP